MREARTFSSTDWRRSQAAWAEGEFGPEWAPFRAAAAKRGMIDPPTGDRFDQRDDESPSQRAIVYQEITDRPRHLLEAIGQSRSWSQVVARCIRHLDELREEVGLDEPPQRSSDGGRRQAAESVGQILRRLATR